jgi:protein dpy-30
MSNPSGSHEVQPGSYREKLLQLPTRAYLDETVVPVLMQALAAASRERPEDPVEFVANFLLKNNPKTAGRTGLNTLA